MRNNFEHQSKANTTLELGEPELSLFWDAEKILQLGLHRHYYSPGLSENYYNPYVLPLLEKKAKELGYRGEITQIEKEDKELLRFLLQRQAKELKVTPGEVLCMHTHMVVSNTSVTYRTATILFCSIQGLELSVTKLVPIISFERAFKDERLENVQGSATDLENLTVLNFLLTNQAGLDYYPTQPNKNKFALMEQRINSDSIRITRTETPPTDPPQETESFKIELLDLPPIPEDAIIRVLGLSSIDLSSEGVSCSTQQLYSMPECCIIAHGAFKGLVIPELEQGKENLIEIYLERIKKGEIDDSTKLFVTISVKGQESGETILAKGAATLYKPEVEQTPSLQFSMFKRSSNLLGAMIEFNIEFRSTKTYPRNSKALLSQNDLLLMKDIEDLTITTFERTPDYSIGFEETTQLLLKDFVCYTKIVNLQRNFYQRDCEREDKNTIKISPLSTLKSKPGRNFRLDIVKLFNPHCKKHSFNSSLTVIAPDNTILDVFERKGKLELNKDQFTIVATASSTPINDNTITSTVQITLTRATPIEGGSYLLITLPNTATWIDGDSTCTVLSGLDGGVCSRVYGYYDFTLKISGLGKVFSEKSSFELAGFTLPNTGVHDLKLALRTSLDCEYGVGKASFGFNDEGKIQFLSPPSDEEEDRDEYEDEPLRP